MTNWCSCMKLQEQLPVLILHFICGINLTSSNHLRIIILVRATQLQLCNMILYGSGRQLNAAVIQMGAESVAVVLSKNV